MASGSSRRQRITRAHPCLECGTLVQNRAELWPVRFDASSSANRRYLAESQTPTSEVGTDGERQPSPSPFAPRTPFQAVLCSRPFGSGVSGALIVIGIWR